MTIEPRCSCHERTRPNSAPELLARFVADLVAHGARARAVDPLVLRRELAHTGDDGSSPFAKRKR